MPRSKKCADCRAEKSADEFTPAPGNPDYLSSRCYSCAVLSAGRERDEWRREHRAKDRHRNR